MVESSRIERLPPQNIEAEEAILGCLLIDPDAIIKIASFLRPEDFYSANHGSIYDAIMSLNGRQEPIDFVTLVDELERSEQLANIGGPAYIADLISTTPTAIYVDHYARIVERGAPDVAPPDEGGSSPVPAIPP